MVQLIAGGKGSGKTKKAMEMANEQVQSTTGHVVYIDDDMKHSFEIHHDIRLMNMEEFPIKSSEEFFGFLCGIVSTDYDIETIYIDGLINILGIEASLIPDYIEKMDSMCDQFDVNIVVTLSLDEEALPENLKEMVI
jgi:hypothetical protein